MDQPAIYTDNPAMVSAIAGIDPKSIGQRIIAVRKAMNMTAADFARHVGFSTATLSNYETGYRRPELDKAMLLVQKTGMTLDYLYLGDASGLPLRLTSRMEADREERKAG